MPDFCCLRWRFRYALRFESCAKLLLRIELTSARAALGSAAAADNVKPALMSSRRSIGMLSSISTFSKQKTNGPAGSFNGGGRAKSEWSRIGGVDSTAAAIDTPPPRPSLMPLAPSLGSRSREHTVSLRHSSRRGQYQWACFRPRRQTACNRVLIAQLAAMHKAENSIPEVQ